MIKTKSFKEDFGSFFQKSIGSGNSPIIITPSLLVHNLILYSKNNSSITGDIDGKIATFDFKDNVLKVFIWVFNNLKLINRLELEKQIMVQKKEPIKISFYKEKPYITGMTLRCRLGVPDKSIATEEIFIPLIIDEAEIVQEPVAVMLKQPHIIDT